MKQEKSSITEIGICQILVVNFLRKHSEDDWKAYYLHYFSDALFKLKVLYFTWTPFDRIKPNVQLNVNCDASAPLKWIESAALKDKIYPHYKYKSALFHHSIFSF